MKFDEEQVRKSIATLKPDNELFEIRIISADKSNYSGYFRDVDTMVAELKKLRSEGNVYFTLNYINDACYDRKQKDKFVKNAKETTSDNDILFYEWLMVDIDPKRPAGTSSTNEQLDAARALGNKIFKFMGQIGFEKPVTAFSGNGVHLLYRLELQANTDNRKLVETALKTLDMLFSTKEIEVDRKNFNQSRICKLYGTMAQKGTSSEERPHRLSRINGDGKTVKATDIEYLKKLCGKFPQEPEKPQRYNGYSPARFDLDEWLNRYGIGYRADEYSDGTKYILDECPFDSNHKGKDACIFKSRNGAIGFHCFHNSCADKKWRDVRMLFEPDAYEREWQEREDRMYKDFNRNKKTAPKPIEKVDGVPVFYTAMDIYNLPKVEESFVKTGIDTIDKRMRGLKKGNVSLMSGLRASGKSSVISQIILSAVDGGNNVGCFSGELSERNFMKWMNLQAAGKSRVSPSKYEGYYYVSDKYRKVIADWLGKHFWLYNNDYGNNFVGIMDEFEKAIKDNSLDLLILDNLMAFNINGLSDNKWDAQTEFVLKLSQMAKKHDIHILFVAHPRKSMGLLRLEDISGSADLANAVDEAFIVHRNNNDFKKRSKETFGWREDNEAYDGTNVIEIAKDRDGGTQDVFIPLFYEAETKRLKNYQSENRIFGWDTDNDGFTTTDIDDSPFM